MDIFDVGHVGDRRQQIILVGDRRRVATRIEADFLQQHAADCLGKPAGDLPLDHRRIDDDTAILV